MWKTLNGIPLDVNSFLETNAKEETDIYIGTDSQRVGKRIKFITVIVCVLPGKGGRVIQKCKIIPSKDMTNLRDRLIHETWLSIEVAQEVSKIVPNDLTIHLDVNQSPKYKSGKYRAELTGFVAGLGYKYEVKPNSWAASCVADKKTR